MPRAKSASPFLGSTPIGTRMPLGRPKSVEAAATLAGGNSRPHIFRSISTHGIHGRRLSRLSRLGHMNVQHSFLL